MIKEVKPIIFNGNNYSAEWEKEAGKRKLLNLKNTVDALPELTKAPVVDTFEKHKVLNKRELEARQEIMFEQYIKTVNVEAQLMVLMANRYILPAALRYLTEVGAERGRGQGRGRRQSREAKKLLIDVHEAGRRVQEDRRQARARRRPLGRLDREAREVHARHRHPDDGRAARARRSHRDDRAVGRVAAADVSRDAVHQVGAGAPGRDEKRRGADRERALGR